MIGYKGTRAGILHQYIENKPDEWGFKVFCRASSSGIIHDLLLYQGASTFFNVTLSVSQFSVLYTQKSHMAMKSEENNLFVLILLRFRSYLEGRGYYVSIESISLSGRP